MNFSQVVGALLAQGATINSSQPFFKACRSGDDELVEQFLRGFNIDVNFTRDSWSILGMAVLKEVAPHLIDLMLQKGAAVNQQGKLVLL